MKTLDIFVNRVCRKIHYVGFCSYIYLKALYFLFSVEKIKSGEWALSLQFELRGQFTIYNLCKRQYEGKRHIGVFFCHQ